MIHRSKGLDSGNLNGGERCLAYLPFNDLKGGSPESLSLAAQQPLGVKKGQAPELDNRQCAN